MKTHIISLLILFTFFGCVRNLEWFDNVVFDDEYINGLAKKEGTVFLRPFMAVIPLNDKWIVFNNKDVYEYVYIPWILNRQISYYEFLKNIYSGEIQLDSSDVKEKGYYIIDEKQKIIKEYKENGFNYIMNKYLIEEDGELILNADLKAEDYYGLMKIMFLKGFYVSEDDLEGKLVYHLLKPGE